MSDVKTVHLPLIGRTVKLGRVKPAKPAKVLRLKSFLLGPVGKPAPKSLDYYTKARPGISQMDLNDQIGCCVIAAKAHAFAVWCANDGGRAVTFAESEIRSKYNLLKAGPGDSGCNMADVLDWLEKNDFTDDQGGKHRIAGRVAVDVTNKEEVKTALYLFGALDVGFNVTQQMVNTAREGAVWRLADFTRSYQVGGHDVLACGHNDGPGDPKVVGVTDDGIQVATWGVIVTFAWDLFARTDCVSECYAILAPDWTGSDKVNAATGLDVTALQKALEALGGGTVPPIPDPKPVDPPAPVVPPAPAPQPVLVNTPYVETETYRDWFGTHTRTRSVTFAPAAKAAGLSFDQIQQLIGDVLQLLQSDPVKQVEQAVWEVITDAKAGKYGQVLADVLAVWPAVLLLVQEVTALVTKYRQVKGSFRGILAADPELIGFGPGDLTAWVEAIAALVQLIQELRKRKAA